MEYTIMRCQLGANDHLDDIYCEVKLKSYINSKSNALFFIISPDTYLTITMIVIMQSTTQLKSSTEDMDLYKRYQMPSPP
jgi:Na+-translocating ferredoxin:NAD+ oxidoreductase RnfE subunit